MFNFMFPQFCLAQKGLSQRSVEYWIMKVFCNGCQCTLVIKVKNIVLFSCAPFYQSYSTEEPESLSIGGAMRYSNGDT